MLNNFKVNNNDPRCILCNKKMHYYSTQYAKYYTCGNSEYNSHTNHFSIGWSWDWDELSQKLFEEFNIEGYRIIFFKDYLYIHSYDSSIALDFEIIREYNSNIDFSHLSSKEKIEDFIKNYYILC